MKLMDKAGVIRLAEELIEQYPGNLYYPPNLLAHLRDTYEIAEETARRLIANYPYFEKHLSVGEVALGGGLHDIGLGPPLSHAHIN